MRIANVAVLLLVGCGAGVEAVDAGSDTPDAGAFDAGYQDAGTPPKLLAVTFHYEYREASACPADDVRATCNVGIMMTAERYAGIAAQYPSCKKESDGTNRDITCLGGCGFAAASCPGGASRQVVSCGTPPKYVASTDACGWEPL